ncbi:MAG: hypothetical protein JNL67_11235 [Planctomycetaceae bacterium]|nr:hypothetical protein [Planctomycetaceae bacterium]
MLSRVVLVGLLFAWVSCSQVGCSRHPLTPRAIPLATEALAPPVIDNAAQIQRGQPRPIIDGLGWVVGIPSKLILWDRRVDNHRIGLETENALAEYIAENQLHGVRVRLTQYRPGEDWVRLVRNKSVGAGWRFTLGTFSVLGETVFPGRIFGGDHYNPFTNTIHLYSDVPAIALHEGAHAKDFARREWKGTYGAAYLLPVVPLYHESVATSDVFDYLQKRDDPPAQAEAARILYPAYGTYAGNAAGTMFAGYSSPLYWVGLAGGHVAGRMESDRILSEAADREAQSFPTTAAESAVR